ncbi:MAG TPA: hypothetical protein VF159_01540 [Gemmatimonadaceae bacterium]
MYSTCIHCHGPLGANELVEHFPLGRRLAFDADKGRLWVVCPRCREWNLTPLEERWEAIEECERLYRGTRLRVSTDQIGLARLREGLELIRIGKPLRPEIAAWRYGAEFRRRRTSAVVPATLSMGALYVANILSTAEAISEIAWMGVAAGAIVVMAPKIVRSWKPRIVFADGRVRRLRIKEYTRLRLEPTGDAWRIRWNARDEDGLDGHAAEAALRSIMAGANAVGGKRADVTNATRLLEDVGGPGRFIPRLARAVQREGSPGIMKLELDVRLALEMALHEETERAALEGELETLADDWRVAEEIAAISDNLLLPLRVAALSSRTSEIAR